MNLKNQFIIRALQSCALIVLLLLNALLLKFILNYNIFGSNQNTCSLDCITIHNSTEYDFDTKYFSIQKFKLKKDQLLPDIFKSIGLSNTESNKAINNIGQVFNLRNLRTNNICAFVHSNDCESPDFFIYEIDASKYIKCELNNAACASIEEKSSYLKEEIASGTIESSLWDALDKNGVSINIIDQMEDALASSVDFHHVQKGNSFKLIFERLYVGDQPTNTGKLLAASFHTEDNNHFAYSFIHNNKLEYYDAEGRPMRRSFLKAPVRFSRISSPFNMRRFHPVLKYHKPHLGTDYAAPYGTPILAVGAGVVEAASYTGGNGRYVKIRHDKTYETQYLHMSKFATGIRAGSSVSQGQVIGYIGSSGLATGPHVCFRFWKNGVQVDPRKLSFPSPDPLPSSILPDFYIRRDMLRTKLDGVEVVAMVNSNVNRSL